MTPPENLVALWVLCLPFLSAATSACIGITTSAEECVPGTSWFLPLSAKCWADCLTSLMIIDFGTTTTWSLCKLWLHSNKAMQWIPFFQTGKNISQKMLTDRNIWRGEPRWPERTATMREAQPDWSQIIFTSHTLTYSTTWHWRMMAVGEGGHV